MKKRTLLQITALFLVAGMAIFGACFNKDETTVTGPGITDPPSATVTARLLDTATCEPAFFPYSLDVEVRDVPQGYRLDYVDFTGSDGWALRGGMNEQRKVDACYDKTGARHWIRAKAVFTNGVTAESDTVYLTPCEELGCDL